MEEGQVRPVETGGNRLGDSGRWSGAGLEWWERGQGVQVGGPNTTSDLGGRRDLFRKKSPGYAKMGKGVSGSARPMSRFGWIEGKSLYPS